MALLFLVMFLLLAPAIHVAGEGPQKGFLSIDCGLDDKYSGYNDPDNGVYYVSDGPYVDAGENLRVSTEYESGWRRPYHTVRSFPSGLRNCYRLPTVAGAKYLLRMDASYGNYDGKNDNSSLQFDLYLGPNYWSAVFAEYDLTYEAVFIAWASWAPICFVNTGHGPPFVSVLELRQLDDALYPSLTTSKAMSLYARRNLAGRFTRRGFGAWYSN